MAFVASANDPYAAHDASEFYSGGEHYMSQSQPQPHTQHMQQAQHAQHAQHAQQPHFQHQLQHYPTSTDPPMHDPSMPSFYSGSMANLSGDIKPRLTKEQHDILESHYQKQQKPNTSTKKNFAESLQVSLEKVNVSGCR